MESKYIQLPLDMPTECIEMIWLYTRLSKHEQEMIRDFLRENLKKEDKNLDETELAKAMRESEAEVNPDIQEYTDLMKKLIGVLIAQSCDMAALVYQNYCIEKKSVEEISTAFRIDEESVRLMVQYYEKRTAL